MNTRLNEDQVRQGVTGHHVRIVLALSLGGAIVAAIVIAILL